MSLDFQQVNQQVREMGESAPERERRLKKLREEACRLLLGYAQEIDALREKVALVVRQYEPTLRCALPVSEPLDAAFSAQAAPKGATIIAADGSQINLDRHAQVQYGLVNVGAICIRLGFPQAPVTRVKSQLIYDERLDTLTEATLALMRDLDERAMLLEMAKEVQPPVITFTDGPIELWGARSLEREAVTEYQKSIREYLRLLHQLNELGVTTAGYVDKPGANLVVRLLEVAITAVADLPNIQNYHPLRGVMDIDLYTGLLGVGERSAVFALQSQTGSSYEGVLALHFFYLNVGRENHPYIARVDIPAWVAEDAGRMDDLQAVLVEQCRAMGLRHYPYLLHRAHETALVSLQEQEQVTQMIAFELRRRSIILGERSHKQAAKELERRRRYGT
jgi:NurA domain